MTIVAAPLGILAFLGLTASACCASVEAQPLRCHGGPETPGKTPEQPIACHATQSCAEHRKLRTIP